MFLKMFVFYCLVFCVLKSVCHAHILGRLKTENGVPQSIKLDLNNEEVMIKLSRVVGFLSPHFLLVLRNNGREQRNATTPHPSCLYRGQIAEKKIFVSLSTCDDTISADAVIDNTHFNIEILAKHKRDIEDIESSSAEEELIVIERQVSHEAKCGLTERNLKKLRIGDRPVIKLKRKKRRSKRSSQERVIEIAVFVDNEMYNANKLSTEAGTISKIQDLVFTYLNAVQLLYMSDLLTNKLRLVLVRLEIMTTQPSELQTAGGDIESYLENFCSWQKSKNPGSLLTGDSTNTDHWDHALLLTGLNLYDGSVSQDSVIGLAWVSGMCHPEYSCTINEGHNYESVFVIAHEMGHNLGMVHDGEQQEGNTCSPDKYLMSPVLGPGKVTWSSCSNSELTYFLTGSETRLQATCLDDIPAIMDDYDFNSEQLLPGEKVSALDQCVKSFGIEFKPYLKTQSPFEDLCRELWCSNITHALRAHPALEGTDCSSKPYPYGSECRGGQCVPYNPNVEENEITGSSGSGETQPVVEGAAPSPSPTLPEANERSNGIDDTPSWYDPIYNRIFSDLRRKYKEQNPVLMMNPNRNRGFVSNSLHSEEGNVSRVDGEQGAAAWQLMVEDCPVECGGGWTQVEHTCQLGDRRVEEEQCDMSRRPQVTKLPCATSPCS